MMDNLKPYPAMKDSGLLWLGEIPQHWELSRGKRLFDSIDIRSTTGEEELLTVSSEKGIIRRSSANVTMFKAESYVGYKLCWPDDLVINSLWAWARGLGVSQHHGIVSSAYGVYRLKRPYSEYSNYIHELVRSTPFQWELQVRSKGIWVSRLQLTDEAFLDAPFPIPPPHEQIAIVRFLDHVERRIRRYTHAKQKLIKLLEEQKQAIINRVVTRGLDPNVHLKPSGLEWLGDVPKHWEVKPAKWFFYEVDERSETGDEEPLSVSHISGVTPRSQKSITMFMAASYVGHKLCRLQDLAINTMWAWMGALGVSHHTGIVSPSYAVYRPHRSSTLSGEYCDLLLRTRPYISEFACRSTGIRSSRLRLYPEQFLRIPLICPPPEEQLAILEFLTLETSDTANAIAKSLRELDLVREYRTRLIADVVTGKLDVREISSKLPEESEEIEPVYEPDDEITAGEEPSDEIDETLEPIEA
jgi:type I restriction enzyme, S subunit